MKKITKLALLQLEQYDTARYLHHKVLVDDKVAQRINWTKRLKITSALSNLLGIVGANLLIEMVVRPTEKLIYLETKKRILELKKNGLRVVAIAGSYGKTSVKNYAYEMLRKRFKVVATPESFNTIMGIAKCLKWEVDEKTEILIVEVGAYKIGDIACLLEMVSPDIGVLTGMARQHLERFGSWENIQIAKSEIAVYMAKHGKLVANGSDPVVVKNVEKLGVKVAYYRGKTRQEINLSGARAVAQILGMSVSELSKIKVREPRSRFEMTIDRYGMRVIDDSFSSNDVGFVSAIEYLASRDQFVRILVTPGLVELGSESSMVHEHLGRQIIGKADYVILVGDSERTRGLEKGIGGKVPVIYIKKTLDFMQTVKNLKLTKEPLVLLENDVTENY